MLNKYQEICKKLKIYKFKKIKHYLQIILSKQYDLSFISEFSKQLSRFLFLLNKLTYRESLLMG